MTKLSFYFRTKQFSDEIKALESIEKDKQQEYALRKAKELNFKPEGSGGREPAEDAMSPNTFLQTGMIPFKKYSPNQLGKFMGLAI